MRKSSGQTTLMAISRVPTEVISTLQARVYELTRALWEQKGWCDGCAGEEAVKEGTWV